MLAKLRRRVERYTGSAAAVFAALPAWVYTIAGLAVLIPYLYCCAYTRSPLCAALLLLLSGFFDAIDGAVARFRGEAGPRGAFLDSFTDRVADILYGAGFLLLGYPPLLVYVAVTSALLVSYARARYESLVAGESLEGLGIMERSDRVLAQLSVLLLHGFVGADAAVVAYTVYAALVAATAFQRCIAAYLRLGGQRKT